jgi:hypothetical protein
MSNTVRVTAYLTDKMRRIDIGDLPVIPSVGHRMYLVDSYYTVTDVEWDENLRDKAWEVELTMERKESV